MPRYDKSMIRKGLFIIGGSPAMYGFDPPRSAPRYGDPSPPDDLDEIKQRLQAVKTKIEELSEAAKR